MSDMKPPRPLVPRPALSLTAPARPAVELPLPNVRLPLFPDFAEPLLKIRPPEQPPMPLFADAMEMWPLLDCVPSPAFTAKLPPEVIVLLPAVERSVPPAPLVPLPTVATTAPPLPPDDAAEPTAIDPLFPTFVKPELNTRQPLDPAEPVFEEWISNFPLLVDVPSLEPSTNCPPLAVVE